MSVKLPGMHQMLLPPKFRGGAAQRITGRGLSWEGPQAPARSHLVSELSSWRRRVGLPPGHERAAEDPTVLEGPVSPQGEMSGSGWTDASGLREGTR